MIHSYSTYTEKEKYCHLTYDIPMTESCIMISEILKSASENWSNTVYLRHCARRSELRATDKINFKKLRVWRGRQMPRKRLQV